MTTVRSTAALKDKSELDSKDGSPSVSSVQLPVLDDQLDDKPRRFRWRRRREDLDSVATQPSVFDDPKTLEVYRPPPVYEGFHRFDPDARWTWREERRLIRKIDVLIMIWAWVMFFALDLDRINITQANTDNFLPDLGMTTNDYNIGNSLFKICFLAAELPSQLVSKRVGPDVWIPTQMVLWSIAALCQFWLSGRGSFLALRCLLGFLQGGFIPDVILYLSYFYTTSELAIRLAWFWVSNYAASIVGAFLATGILRLGGVHGRAGWRYLFLIEGGFTLLVGLGSYYMMPPSPTQTKAWYRPKGWFTEREEIIMVNRVLRDDPSKSDMHNREGLTPAKIWKVLKDWRMWPIYILGLLHMIPVTPPQTYLTLSLRHLGFTTTQSNLLSIPSTVLGMITLLISCYLSEMISSRTIAAVILQFWALPLLVALYTFTEQTSQWVYYAVVTLIVGYPYVHPIQVAWTSANSGGVGTRTVSASVYNMFVQAGGIVSAYIYRSYDAAYRHGNRDLIGITVMNIFVYLFTFIFYRTINKRRERKWDSLTPDEQQKYLDTTQDQGNARLNFRFVY
ncbi:MFS general substrate transporter [Laetiporus sulphureus 93-53]|uniref:MFS general substrate transporter n=1 Tax=Laetiporus sulphureus 93-53 TaxID=1314785 RepID=A0A165F7S1_9APHY|nr:MFS general substrate transporter [Laetiporus sulphureus 93-53]KZT08559.1 MFS general substrate transporter [Laetiporus sulphureus 93-53]